MQRPPSDPGRALLFVVAAAAFAFLLVPTLLIVPMSFSGNAIEFPPTVLSLRWYRSFLESRDWTDAAIISLQDATLTMLLATPCGVAAAYYTVQAPSRIARWLFGALTLPMMMPAVLLGIGLYFVYADLGLNNTLMGLVIAHVGLTLPYVYVLSVARLKSFDFQQERAAQSLGAPRLQAFLRVTLPQIRPAVTSAALVSFIFAFDEGVISFFISTGDRSTLPRRMFLSLEYGLDPTIAAISSGLILGTFCLVIINLALTGTRRGGQDT